MPAEIARNRKKATIAFAIRSDFEYIIFFYGPSRIRLHDAEYLMRDVRPGQFPSFVPNLKASCMRQTPAGRLDALTHPIIRLCVGKSVAQVLPIRKPLIR